MRIYVHPNVQHVNEQRKPPSMDLLSRSGNEKQGTRQQPVCRQLAHTAQVKATHTLCHSCGGVIYVCRKCIKSAFLSFSMDLASVNKAAMDLIEESFKQGLADWHLALTQAFADLHLLKKYFGRPQLVSHA